MNSNFTEDQLARFGERIEARLERIELLLVHHQELDNERQRMLRQVIGDLKGDVEDHEMRLRVVSEAAVQFKVLAALATGGGLLSLVTLLKALLGG